MKKILHLLPLLLGIYACGTQPLPTQDVSNIVNATLTAFAQNNSQVTASQPTLTPTISVQTQSTVSQTAMNSEIVWKTYRNEVYRFKFEYPEIYDELPYRDSCGLRENSDGIQLGHQIQLLFLDSGGLNLTEYTSNLLQSKGWSVDSQQNGPINGVEATTIQYRSGGTNRFGTFTLIKPDDHIFALNFTAGSFCDVPESQASEPNVYSHMIETFRVDK